MALMMAQVQIISEDLESLREQFDRVSHGRSYTIAMDEFMSRIIRLEHSRIYSLDMTALIHQLESDLPALLVELNHRKLKLQEEIQNFQRPCTSSSITNDIRWLHHASNQNCLKSLKRVIQILESYFNHEDD